MKDIEVEDRQSTSPSDSDSGTNSRDSTSPSTSPPSAKEEEERKVKALPRKRRFGRVVSGLRAQIGSQTVSKRSAVSSARMEVVPWATSTTADLANGVAQSALAYHLLQISEGEMPQPSVPPTLSLSELRLEGTSAKGSPAYRECVMACLMAFGSRRSMHSAITGSIKLDNLGARRDPACYALTNRAISLAEQSGILKAVDTPEAQRLAEILRSTLYSVTGGHHPYMGDLADLAIEQLVSSKRQGRSRHADLQIMYDAISSCGIIRRSRVSDEDLHRFGITPEVVLESFALLDKMTAETACDEHGCLRTPIVEALRATSIFTIRTMLDTSRRLAEPDLVEFTKSYDRMRSFMDVSERAVLIIAKNPDLTKSLGITPSTFLTLPQWCETNFMSLAYRNSVAYPDPGPFLILFQVPYLRWLRHFATMCRELPSTQGGTHTLAVLFRCLEGFPFWIPLSVEAAKQHEASRGGLAAAGFTWADLDSIYEGLEASSDIFAHSAAKAAALAEAIAAVRVPREQTAPVEPGSEELASKLVLWALDDLA